MAVEEEKDSLEVLHTQQQATLITLRANLQEERTRTPQTQHTKWHQLSSVCLWFVVTCLVLLFYTHSVQVSLQLRSTYHIVFTTVLKEKVTALQKVEKEPSLKLIEMEKTNLSLRAKNAKLSSECR